MAEEGDTSKNLDSNAPPLVSTAPSARAKCQNCKEPIEKGATRISMVGRSSGVSVYKHLHAACFCRNAIVVDYAPTGRATCKASQQPIAKGEPRLLMRLTNCSGEATVTQIYKPASVAELFRSLTSVEGAGGITASTVRGLDSLEQAHREWVVDALSGKDVSSLPVPVKAGDVAKPSAKKKPASKPVASKGKAGADVAPTASKRQKTAPAPAKVEREPDSPPESAVGADGDEDVDLID